MGSFLRRADGVDMPQYPIPDDWNGQDWKCWCIEWPDSQDWLTLLYGWITTPKRGRFWDGSSGTITDAQEIGKQIYQRNFNLEECLVSCNDTFINLLTEISTNIAITASATAGCGCSGGSIVPTTPGSEAGIPPYRYSEPPSEAGSPEFELRKCQLAYIGHSNIREYVSAIDASGVDAIISATGRAAIPIVTTTIGVLLGELATPFPILDAIVGGVVGFVLGVALSLLEDGIDLADIVTNLDANEEDYICALYLSSGATEAIMDYLQVASSSGMSTANQGVLSALLWVDWLNVLYFSPDGVSAGLETVLEDFQSPVDCSVCGCSNVEVGDIILTPGTHTWTSEESPNQYEIKLAYQCGCNPWIDVTFNSIAGWTDRGSQFIDFRLHSACGGFNDGDIYNSLDTFPAGQRYCFKQLVFWSATPFTINVTVHGECSAP